MLSGSREVKLEHDARVLNSAVRSYLAFGGDFSGIKDPEEVLAMLKEEIPESERDRFVGLGGSFLDPRVLFLNQSAEEAKTAQPRLYWDSDSSRFIRATSGPPGIKAVGQDDSAIPTVSIGAKRKNSFTYASEDNWIWDFVEEAPPARQGPSDIITTTVPDNPIPPIAPKTPPVDPGPQPPLKRDTLLPPEFSIPPGTYPITSFDLGVALIDPNPAGAATIFYSIDYGAWSQYASASTISIGPDTSLKAQAVPVDTLRWEASVTTEAFYDAISASLDPPLIELSKPLFNRNN